MQITNKIFVVTGAGSGIGRELSLQLIKRKAKVAGVDIYSEGMEELLSIANVGEDYFKGFVVDITDRTSVDQLPMRILNHFGGVDGIINNAGIIQPFKPVQEISYLDIEKVMNVNFYGTVHMTKAFLPILIDRPNAHIVNISSMGGLVPVPGQTMYGAAKAAVKLFTEGLHSELVDTNVKVTLIIPGAIATKIKENSGLGKTEPSTNQKSIQPLSAYEAAEAIISAIELNKSRLTIGKDAKMLDIFSRISPQTAAGLIQKKMRAIK